MNCFVDRFFSQLRPFTFLFPLPILISDPNKKIPDRRYQKKNPIFSQPIPQIEKGEQKKRSIGMDEGGGSANSTAGATGTTTSDSSGSIFTNYPLISALLAFTIAQSLKLVSLWYTSPFLCLQCVCLCVFIYFLIDESLNVVIVYSGI